MQGTRPRASLVERSKFSTRVNYLRSIQRSLGKFIIYVLFLVWVFSWFAGHMNETEAANLLEDQSPGSFLVRISSSRAHDGVFVLAVKTSNNGVVQIQIEVSRTLLLEKMSICFLSQ